MNYIIPLTTLVAPSLQEFFLANRGGYHNSQINGANISKDDLAISKDPKQQC